MNILFIGVIVGKSGRQAVTALFPKLRRDYHLDCTIANGENAAHGAGVTTATVRELLAAGVDVITTGDHVWDQKGFEQFRWKHFHRLRNPDVQSEGNQPGTRRDSGTGGYIEPYYEWRSYPDPNIRKRRPSGSLCGSGKQLNSPSTVQLKDLRFS